MPIFAGAYQAPSLLDMATSCNPMQGSYLSTMLATDELHYNDDLSPREQPSEILIPLIPRQPTPSNDYKSFLTGETTPVNQRSRASTFAEPLAGEVIYRPTRIPKGNTFVDELLPAGAPVPAPTSFEFTLPIVVQVGQHKYQYPCPWGLKCGARVNLDESLTWGAKKKWIGKKSKKTWKSVWARAKSFATGEKELDYGERYDIWEKHLQLRKLHKAKRNFSTDTVIEEFEMGEGPKYQTTME